MSLIPSESYTFPDHFTTTVTPLPEPKEKRSSVTLKVLQPAAAVVPIERQGDAKTPQSHRRRSLAALLKRAGRWKSFSSPEERQLSAKEGLPVRGPKVSPCPTTKLAMPTSGIASITVQPSPVGNVIPMQVPSPPRAQQLPSRIARGAVPTIPQVPARRVASPKSHLIRHPAPAAQPRPAIPLGDQPDFFEVFAQNNDETLLKRRRRMKFRRFIVCECFAVAILLPLAFLGLSRQLTNPIFVWMTNIFTIAAAFAVAVIPIAFYAFTPTLPEIDR